MKLLFTLAEWHGYAKLRLHTDETLSHLRDSTKELGSIIRRFSRSTCEAYQTSELPGEQARRARRQQAKASKSAPANPVATSAAPPAPPARALSKRKTLNMCTYKLHALGDYFQTILRFGTTDSYSTQIVRHNHTFIPFAYQFLIVLGGT